MAPLFINSNEVAKIINQSRLAIITPSVTVNEVYFMGIDFVAIMTASNQKGMYKYLKKNKFLTMKRFDKNKLSFKIKKSESWKV